LFSESVHFAMETPYFSVKALFAIEGSLRPYFASPKNRKNVP
jgi:hypothetical protein